MAGVAVGAVIAPKRHLQTLIKALDERGWRKRARLMSVDTEIMAVPLAPQGARALDQHMAAGNDGAPALPGALAQLLGDGEIQWASGMRDAAATSALGAAASASIVPAQHHAALAGAPPAGAEPAFRYAELFAGIGGFRLGLDALGGRCVFASEIDPCAMATYERNFGVCPSGDITEVPTEALPAHDVLTAGFPCQSFSRAGEQGGLDDARGDLFYEIVRVATACRPAALLLENVPNLLRVDDGHTLHVILGALTAAGYHVRVQVVNALAVVPQHRERLFIVGFRADLAAAARRFVWPRFGEDSAPVPRLHDVLEGTLPEARLRTYRLTPTQWLRVQASRDYQTNPQWRLAQLNGAARTLRGSYRKSFGRLSEFVPLAVDGSGELAEPTAGAGAADDAAVEPEGSDGGDDDDDNGGGGCGGKDSGGTEVCRDGGAGEGSSSDDRHAADGAEPKGPPVPAPRFYTERECARLQGFPDSLALEGSKLYTQLGNAVNPLLVRAIGRCVLEALGGDGGLMGQGGKSEKAGAVPDVQPAAVEADESCPAARRCEDFLCVASINLLRGVTPPQGVECEEAAEGYGRYGHEEPAIRRQRVCNRPPTELFCMKCVSTYSLQAARPPEP